MIVQCYFETKNICIQFVNVMKNQLFNRQFKLTNDFSNSFWLDQGIFFYVVFN